MALTSKGQPGGLAKIANPQPVVADLIATVGTADGTLADVTAAFSQSILNNNFRDLSDKLNALLAALRTAGLIV